MSGKLNDSTDYGAFTYKKFTETFFKIEVISDCRYIVKDTDVEIDKEIVHRYQTQEDAWNAAMLCANRQTFDLSVKMPGSVHMSVNHKEQTISVIGSDNQLKRRKRLNFRHGYKNPRPHFCNRSTLIIHI